MAITIRSAQTISNGVTLRGNNTQFITPNPLPVLFELDASIYASGTTWLDQSGNNRHATLHGSPTWTSDAGGCFVFNNDSSKYIDIAGSSGGWGLENSPAQASFSVWANIAGTGWYQHIAGWRGGLDFWFLLLNGVSNTEARFAPGPVYDIGIDYAPYYGTWALTTFVVDAANSCTKLYINGIEVGNTTGVSGNFPAGGNNFSLGCNLGFDFPMNGKIGGSVAYSKALTNGEVFSEFNRTKSRYGL